LDDSFIGTGFGKLFARMKLSSKDILLVFGIIVAIVVTLTTIAYSEQNAFIPRIETPAAGRTTLNQNAGDLLKKTLQRVVEQVRNK
jgi:hypothetical protein